MNGAGPADCGDKIFVGGLPKESTDEVSLRAFFSQFGNVTHVDLKYDDGGGFRGFGFVTFDSVAGAAACIANSANNIFAGKWIDCKSAVKGAGAGPGKGNAWGQPAMVMMP